MDVSIIIVNWNTRCLLAQCLGSVAIEMSSRVRFEVIVVDNASTDGSCEMVRREFPDVKLIVNSENRGFAAANNQALAVAQGRYVLLLNSDTIVLDRAIEKTIAFADRYLDTAVIGCRVLNQDRSLQSTCFMFPSLLNWFLHATYLYQLFPRSRFFGRERMTWWARNDVREVDVVTGCYMLVRRDAIDQVGPLDERFFMYAEETDWCLRFVAKGWKNRFTPEAEIIHLGGGSAPKLGSNRARVSNRSFVRYMFKHWSRSRAIAGVIMLTLFYLLRLPLLVTKRMVWPGGEDDRLLENHWAGLIDMLNYRRHLIS
ncbi:glycosyltransferase family 2 protein [Bradyrhizobium sp. LMG 9283]|uniref:glycosyltransferase family 2 protein n=1 Tax=Bradyrhizobium sp. LMG 9283 TaxID=592064 RepID=UPI00388F4F40